MAARRNLEAELDALKKDVEALRKKPIEVGAPHIASTIANELGELRELVEEMLGDAETGMAEHPVASIAGALALGILIGRMTAR